MLVIGIDVGVNGGLAAISDKANAAVVMPIFQGTPKKGKKKGKPSRIDIKAVYDWVVLAAKNAGEVPVIVVEAQHPMSQQGVTSTFHLGESFGMLETFPLIAGWKLVLVQPKEWKKVVLAGTLKDKDAAIAYAAKKYPELNINVGKRKIIMHDGMADALCIADWGTRREMGTIE